MRLKSVCVTVLMVYCKSVQRSHPCQASQLYYGANCMPQLANSDAQCERLEGGRKGQMAALAVEEGSTTSVKHKQAVAWSIRQSTLTDDMTTVAERTRRRDGE